MSVFTCIRGFALLTLLTGAAEVLADPATRQPGHVEIPMVTVPGGSFELGCFSEQTNCFDGEKPVQTVTVDRFEIGKYEVTQGQWRTIMGSNPSWFDSCGEQCPVETVSWDEVQEFIKKLNEREQTNYRLPTESEWEYACRSGGRSETYCGGNELDLLAWHVGNSAKMIHPVGGKQPNGLGIHDMTGNVFEWSCSDSGKYEDEAKNYGKCSSGGSARVMRGGGWSSGPRFLRTTYRVNYDPGHRFGSIGFRLARSIP
ncbi:MAG: formylglycine-generating enzyme family protein [Magnetococcus sp. MYC-9]